MATRSMSKRLPSRARLTVAALLGLGALAGCASKPPPTQPTVTVRPQPTDGNGGVLEADDPRVVRCGIDDRPRSVDASGADVDDLGAGRIPVGAGAKSFLGDRAVEPPAAKRPFQAGAPAPPFIPPPGERMQPPDPLPPLPDVTIKRLPPRPAPGMTLSSAQAFALPSSNPQYESCRELFADKDAGQHDLDVEFASSGAPLAVRISGVAAPTRMVRCMMERACQLRGVPNETPRAILPVVVERAAPVMIDPPNPPPAVAVIPVDVVLEGSWAGSSNPTAIQVRRVLAEVAGTCGGRAGKVASRTQVRFTIGEERLSVVEPAFEESEVGGALLARMVMAKPRPPHPPFPPPPPPPPPPPQTVTSVRTQLVTPDVSRELLRCTVQGITDRRIGSMLGGTPLRAMVTWNP